MKKVLIVSYIFPPNTTMVSSFRPYSWYLEFEKYGLTPIAVTRHWTSEPIVNSFQLGNEDESPLSIVEEGDKKIYYLPYRNNFFERQARRHEGKTLAKVWELAGLFAGRFTKEADLHHAFYKEIGALIKKEKPKAIILTAMPLSAAKLGYHLKKEFGLPVIIDFRDYINNNLLNDQFNFTGRARFSFKIQELYLKKWLSNADAVMSVSQPILDKLAKFTSARQILIHNGYEERLFENITAVQAEKFTISMIGMLYETQDIDFIIKGFNSFLSRLRQPTDCSIEFIGQDYLPAISERLKAQLPQGSIITTPRISRKEALQKMKSSHVLYYAGWKGWKGIYSGKIFEYLAAQKNVLIAPGDADVIDELVQDTEAGKIANTVEEFSEILYNWYGEWQDGKELKYYGKKEKIAAFTREALAQKLAGEINEIIT